MFEVLDTDGVLVSINPAYLVSFTKVDESSTQIYLSDGRAFTAAITYEDLNDMLRDPRMARRMMNRPGR